MSKIKCSQNKCKYNNSYHCMKDGINVDEHASCDSYEEGPKDYSASKFEFANLESKCNCVNCNATQCINNKNCKCNVNHLNISSKDRSAKCEDYEEMN